MSDASVLQLEQRCFATYTAAVAAATTNARLSAWMRASNDGFHTRHRAVLQLAADRPALSRAVLGAGVPSGVPRAFPHVVSNAKPPARPAAAAKARPILRTARPHKEPY